MKISEISLAILLLSSACSSSQVIGVKEADRRIQASSQAPVAIAKASESVFLMFLADRPQNFDLSTSKKLDAFFAKQEPPFVSFEKKIIDPQIEVCRKNHRMKACPISREIITATAFILGDARSLYTNYHPFFEYFKKVLNVDLERHSQASEVKKILSTKLPVFLFNSDGELVLTPTSHHAFVSNMSAMNLYAKDKNDLLFEYDFVKIDLGIPMEGVAPLEVADVVDHEDIFLAGFTSENSRLSLGISKGTYLPFQEAAQKLGMRPLEMLTEQGKKLATHAAFYFSGLSVSGMSGGPYLNRDGKVVGINRGSRESTSNIEISIGVKSSFMSNFTYPISDSGK
jgi:hypothetical protein